jgi:demethylspheroidene O-methyltransferase
MAATDMPDRVGPLARLRDRLRGWMTGRIADPAFQSWAARFPLTRPIARSSAAQLYDIVAGFVYSQTLFACVELDLFRHLRGGPLTVDELAQRLDLAPDPTERLAQSAAAIGLLLRDGERYALGPLGAAMLGAPGVAEMVRHHRLFYADLADPVALLRGEADPHLRRFWSYVGGANTHAMTAEEAAPYSALMAVSQAMVAEETLAAVPLDGIRHLADVGGGEGAFLEAAARRYPALRVTLFDLPAVADRAEARFRVAGLSERASVRPGSFLDDPLPGDAEAISLVRVLYDHDDPVVVRILAKVHAALPPGGRLILSEPMSGGRHPTRSGDAYFGFYTLAMTTGRPRSPERYAELLAAAGFTSVSRHRTRRDFITSVMTARRL